MSKLPYPCACVRAEAHTGCHRPLILNKQKIVVAHAASPYKHSLKDVFDNPGIANQIKVRGWYCRSAGGPGVCVGRARCQHAYTLGCMWVCMSLTSPHRCTLIHVPIFLASDTRLHTFAHA